MLFAIPFSSMWILLSKLKANPYTPVKYALGMAQLGLGFLIFALSANFMDEAGKVPFSFLMWGYLFITTGELFVSPIGLSKVTELSPKKMVAFMMGVFFLSSAFAHNIAGFIAKLTIPTGDTTKSKGGLMNYFVDIVTNADKVNFAEANEGIVSLMTYTGVFTQIAVIAFFTGLILLIFTPIIKKWMHGIH